MNSTATHGETPKSPPEIEFWLRDTVLRFFGGEQSLHVSTLYRGMAVGRYPRPVRVSGNNVRWIADECRDALAHMIAARPEQQPSQPQPPKKPRGRKRRTTSNIKGNEAKTVMATPR
jgi:hypothetical protein